MHSLFFPANLLLILILKRTKFSLRVVNKENENNSLGIQYGKLYLNVCGASN